MNAVRHPGTQSIINEPMPGQPAQAPQAFAADQHPEMPAFAGARVAGVLCAVVGEFQSRGRQGLPKCGFQLRQSGAGRRRIHVPDAFSEPSVEGPGSSITRPTLVSQRPWAIVNTNISPMPPNSLKFTQAAVLK